MANKIWSFNETERMEWREEKKRGEQRQVKYEGNTNFNWQIVVSV